jgi:hypothetical protein
LRKTVLWWNSIFRMKAIIILLHSSTSHEVFWCVTKNAFPVNYLRLDSSPLLLLLLCLIDMKITREKHSKKHSEFSSVDIRWILGVCYQWIVNCVALICMNSYCVGQDS